jgi:hypothetical protein
VKHICIESLLYIADQKTAIDNIEHFACYGVGFADGMPKKLMPRSYNIQNISAVMKIVASTRDVETLVRLRFWLFILVLGDELIKNALAKSPEFLNSIIS